MDCKKKDKKKLLNVEIHKFRPFYSDNSRILILGSFPSVKSREAGFYYQHPQNRFWKVLSNVFAQPQPDTIAEQMKFLETNQIALWDVIASCEINGSSDSSIKNVVANEIEKVLCESDINKIFANGSKAYELYNRNCFNNTKQTIVKLPSTSPANAAWSLEKLIEQWKIIKI
ncbi:DNA-deoxyinosine glycosylase [Eubacteriaceae bacterium ES3]|nr:DNA-deoxyinosine glycosylase [Eubacteriaceae bacterium ES3]